MNRFSRKSLGLFYLYVWKELEQLTVNPWFAYLSILILQLRRVWDIGQYRDLTAGDTSSYFVYSFGWAKDFTVVYFWSPLYTIYYGTLYKIIPDIPSVTLIHRLVIVFLLAILVLAVMRTLLPHHIAWLISAWWVILPINFNTLYEIHLFSVLLPLLSVCIILRYPSRLSRGIILGILLMSTLLVRNETIISFVLWLIVCLIYEIREIKKKCITKKEYFFSYGIPMLLAILLFGFAYARTIPKPRPRMLELKHTLNVCQIYSFGYQQRYSDWMKSPWLDCQELMQRDFGEPLPSMREAFLSNPMAMLEHFSWNLKLLPAGIQLALFNATSESINPDYVPAMLDKDIVLLPSVLCILVLLVAIINLIKQWKFWWAFWLVQRKLGWILLLCLSATMIIVIPMQRPRPSYMFLFSLTMMALIGMSVFVITKRDIISFYFSRLISILLIVSVFFVPSYFQAPSRQPLLTLYKKLVPAQEFIGIPKTEIVVSGYGQILCNYFTKNSHGGCIGLTYSMFDDLKNGISMSEILHGEAVPVVLIYIDQNFMANYGQDASVQDFLNYPEQYGWKVFIRNSESSSDPWSVYINEVQLNKINP